MSSLLRGVPIRLQGPLQAWGGAAVGDNRPTLAFPTRSGVLGLVAACLGIRRTEATRLLALSDGTRVHVRVDATGTPIVDAQTIQDNPNASEARKTILSQRTYLCDASFAVVVVPGPKTAIETIAQALKYPVFAPFLGRRSCVPSSPLWIADSVSADDPIALFASIPREPEDISTPSREFQNFYLDVSAHPKALRRIPLRDDFTGPLSRQWSERFALHVRVDAPPSRFEPSWETQCT
ncbi:MAG: type I-E CRISPR-associated protein Cas5/CasD [Myxococcota bacterium]